MLRWALIFSARIASWYARCGLSAEEVAHYATLTAAFAESVKACDPAKRTIVATQIKRSSRIALLAETRRLVSIINGQKAVTPSDRIALGMNIRTQPVRRGKPDEKPDLRVVRVEGLAVLLRVFADTGLRTRPAHVIGVTLFYYIGETFPLNRSELQFAGNFSRTRIRYEFLTPLPPGTPVWFVAQWLSPRLEAGPMSKEQKTHLMAGIAKSELQKAA